MIPRSLSLLLGALVALGPAAARAIDIPTGGTPARVEVTSATIAAWHSNNRNVTSCDDDFGEALERFNLNGSWEEWQAGLRVDAAFYFSKAEVTAPSFIGTPCRDVDLRGRYLDVQTLPTRPGGPLPERLWLGYTGRRFEVTLGDSYVSFGRGLTLSLRKTDELGLDNTQRGARVRWTGERFSGTVVAGLTNINNVDEASGRYEPDPNDGVIGATADVALFDRLRVGGSAVTVLFQEPVSSFAPPDTREYDERWLLAGPRIDAPKLTDWLGIYLEGVAQRRTAITGEVETGYGLYGSATAYAGDLTFLLEGKAYGDLAVVQPNVGSVDFRAMQYTQLPTLERVQQQLEHPQQDVAGGRVRVDWTVSPTLGLYFNHGTFRDWSGYLDPESFTIFPATIQDPYAGLMFYGGPWRIHAQAGSRFVLIKGNAVRMDAHADVDVGASLGGGHSLQLHVVHQERSKIVLSESRWREGTLQAGWRWRPHLAVSGILDYTTEDGQSQTWYPGASAEWEITPSSNLRVFAGQSRGGLKCISGVCRVFPPFTGVKSTLTLRF